MVSIDSEKLAINLLLFRILSSARRRRPRRQQAAYASLSSSSSSSSSRIIPAPRCDVPPCVARRHRRVSASRKNGSRERECKRFLWSGAASERASERARGESARKRPCACGAFPERTDERVGSGERERKRANDTNQGIRVAKQRAPKLN